MPKRLTYRRVLSALRLVVFKESNEGYRGYSSSINHRKYRCKIAGCKNMAYAKKFCNAHYIRSRQGVDMNLPIRNRQRCGSCTECGNPTNKNGGWGRCSHCYRNRRRRIMNQEIIKLFEGICSRCGKNFPSYVFDFHHLKNKESAVNFTLGIKVIAREVSKCVLACANCHREIEYGQF